MAKASKKKSSKKRRPSPGIHVNVDSLFNYSVDTESRVIYVGSGTCDGDYIDSKAAEALIKSLTILNLADERAPITIMLNSAGGETVAGMAMYDAIKGSPAPVNIIVFGEACSMACVLLQAATRRVLAPHAVIMFHEGFDAYSSNHPEAIRRWVKFRERYGKMIDETIFCRMKEKKPTLTLQEYQEMNKIDTILTAQEAVDLGLADEIL